MLINDILSLPIDEQFKLLKAKTVELPDYEELANQYDPQQHAVYNHNKRPDKTVTRATGRRDAQGNETTETFAEPVNRVSVPFQKLIVNRTVGFMLGNPVKTKTFIEGEDVQQEQLAAMVQKTLDDNKIDYFNRKLARTVMSECEAAELWYMVEDAKFWKTRLSGLSEKSIYKMRVKLLSPSNGDTLYPLFDEFGDMVAFSREYRTAEAGKNREHFDTYTDTLVIKRTQEQGGQWVIEATPHTFGKIPVVYYHQSAPEWSDVQSMIERFETKLSNFADTNDYFGSPMVKVTGKVISLPGKTDSGKVIQMETGGDASYMSWQHAPESERLEFELLEKLIYSNSQTPNISFEQMKAIGSNLSGFAIRLMFTDAHLKIENKIELFGEMFQRRLNLIKHICGNVINVGLSAAVESLWIEPVFTPYLPKNVKEEIETLAIARGNKPLMSNETAVENNPLVAEVSTELERMKDDTEAELDAFTRELSGTYNP